MKRHPSQPEGCRFLELNELTDVLDEGKVTQMIPYALLMLNFSWGDGRYLQARVLNPLNDGFFFRVSPNRAADFSVPPCRVVCLFLNKQKQTYDELFLPRFSLDEVTTEEDAAQGLEYKVFCIKSDDSAFLARLALLLREYSAYITLKQEMDEAELAETMTGLCLSEAYHDSQRVWKRELVGSPPITAEPLMSVELAVVLDSPHLWEHFLELDFPAFMDYYRKENGLTGHPVLAGPITHIYIGNSYCHHLFPERAIEKKLIDKTIALGLNPVICFAPMAEYLIERYEEQLIFLNAYAGQTGTSFELLINDTGLPILLQTLCEEGKAVRRCFSLTAGVLLNKGKKDPRSAFVPGAAFVSNEALAFSADSAVFRKMMSQRYGVSAFSYECCMEKTILSPMDSILHLPLYQTNTSSNCVLQALCLQGNRGARSSEHFCEHWCEHYYLAFPKPLALIGRWNSLFGFSSLGLDGFAALNRMIRAGLKRLVIRL